MDPQTWAIIGLAVVIALALLYYTGWLGYIIYNISTIGK